MPGLDHFRADQRHPATLVAQISGQQSRKAVSCLLLDLGMGGAQASCHEPFPEGSLAELTVTAPSLWDPLSLAVRVAWVRGEPEGRVRMGLHFQPQTGTQLLILAELLRAHEGY